MRLIRNRVSTGWLRDALPSAWKVLRGYLWGSSQVYIGATSDPERRSKEHGAQGWGKLILLFSTKSLSAAKKMESMLIKLAQGSNYHLRIDNRKPGGEGLRHHKSRYWVYILVG